MSSLQPIKAALCRAFGLPDPAPPEGPAARRAASIYEEQLAPSARRVDQSFVQLMLCQYVVCVAAAVFFTPHIASSQIHAYAATVIGAVITGIPVALAVLRSGQIVTRHTVAACQMMMSGLLIAITGGRVETHFHIFGSLAFLAFYRDARVLLTATVVVALDHFIRGMYWPESVFGVHQPDHWRWIEYTAWVFFEDIFLMISILQSQHTLRDSALQRAELERARDAAEQASRAKDDFIATLSHELRTPLTPSLMTLACLAHDDQVPSEIRSELQMVERNIELEARLIDDLLDLTRIAQGKIRLVSGPVDIHALISHIFETCREEFAAKDLTVETHLNATHCWVSGDGARLQQVFWNLIKNAVKFTPEQGSIQVMTSNDGNRIKIEFIDNGVGIPADVIPRIFHRFEQGGARVTKQFGGLGLGLSICRAIMDLHHGSIRADSRGSGWGSTFTVVLTVTAEPPVARRESETQLLRLSGKLPRRILLVDDHVDTRHTLERLLKRAGYEVTTADCVAAALQEARQHEFDMLISDIGLPDATGYELMSTLHRQYSMRGVAISGYGMEEDIRKSMDAGFSAHLTKPIDFGRLKAAISQALGPRRQHASTRIVVA